MHKCIHIRKESPMYLTKLPKIENFFWHLDALETRTSKSLSENVRGRRLQYKEDQIKWFKKQKQKHKEETLRQNR